MDRTGQDQRDYGEGDYGSSHKLQYQGSGTIPALAEEEMMEDDNDYEDLYDGVNVGEGFSLYHQAEAPASSNMGNGGNQAPGYHIPETRRDVNFSQDKGGLAMKAPEIGTSNHIAAGLGSDHGIRNDISGNTGFQIPMGQKVAVAVDISKANNPVANANMNPGFMNDNIIRPQMGNGPTTLFVGELQWWTTDVELEGVLSQYGKVKEVKFFDERASGKSKGYCQVEFYDSIAAASCKEGMNGYMFNGRACVVTFASAQTLKQMGAAYANTNAQQPQPLNQGRRNVSEGPGRGGGLNHQGGDGGRNFGRTGWRGGNQSAPGRGPGGGGPRGRGGFMGPRNPIGNAPGMGGGAMGNFNQGLGGPGFGGPGGGMMHPQAMMGPGPGFDPTFMGRGAGYGGFPGPGFPGMMPQFPAVNPMGLTGVAPHVNPAFFNRGMTPNGMGMMGNGGMEGPPSAMWGDPSMGGWTGEEHGQKTRESSYGGDDGASDHGYVEGNPEKTARTTPAPREKERDYSGTSDRRYRDEREQDRDRTDRDRKYREEKDSYRDHHHRRRERDSGYEDDWAKGHSSSRPRSRSRVVAEDDHRPRSRDAYYGKRRRSPSV